MPARVRELIEKLVEKVRQMVAPPLVPVPLTPRPRR
jgi:hypothetical protein